MLYHNHQCERYGLNSAKKGFEKLYPMLGTDEVSVKAGNAVHIPVYDILVWVFALLVLTREVMRDLGVG